MKRLRPDCRILAVAALLSLLTQAQGGDLTTDGLTVRAEAEFSGPVTLSAPAATAVPTNGLVLYLPFRSDEGTNTTDQSTAHNDGHVLGPTWQSAGRVDGGSYQFDGTNDYLNLGTDASLAPTELTIALWVKTTTTTHNTDVYVDKQRSVGSAYMLSLAGVEASGGQAGKIEFAFYSTGPNWVKVFGASTINNGAWRHVAVTYSNTTARIYMDGALDASGTMSGGLPYNGTHACKIGQYGYGAAGYPAATLDEVLMYNRPLTATEIYGVYESGLPAHAAAGHLTVGRLSAASNDTIVVEDDLALEGRLSQQEGSATNVLQGRTGIGTDTPQAMLHVAGDLVVDGTQSAQQFVGSGSGLTSLSTAAVSAVEQDFVFRAWTNANPGVDLSAADDFKADGSVPLGGNAKLAGHYLSGDGGNEGVFVDAAGNVGIGTNAPTAALDVAGGPARFSQGVLYVKPLGTLSMGVYTNMP